MAVFLGYDVGRMAVFSPEQLHPAYVSTPEQPHPAHVSTMDSDANKIPDESALTRNIPCR